ncbi:MFS transporter [Paenibacillus elgii]
MGARLGDRLGRKKMFIVGKIIFILGSALCGFASSAIFLIFSRIIQGIIWGLGWRSVFLI